MHASHWQTAFAIYRRHASMHFACSSTLSHQETNHTSLLFFACIHFQCWTNRLHTRLTSTGNKETTVRFHYACLLPYIWQQWRLVTHLIRWAHQYFNKLINPQKLFIYHHHQSVLPKGRSFTANSGTKAAVLPKGRSSTANSETKVAVLQVWMCAVAFRIIWHI